MTIPPTTVDCRGNPVAPGDLVRILDIPPDPDMDDDDADLFNDMIGSTCVVEHLDADGAAWVAIWWNACDGPLLTSVGLLPAQMEKAAA